MISRRRLLAGAVTGATLLMVPREVLTPARPAAAAPAMRTPDGASAVPAGSSSADPALSPSTPPSPPPVTDTQTPDADQTAEADVVSTSAGYDVVVESLAYREQIGTVYRPEASTAHPVVYFLHGGFWESGTRHTYDREARIWAERGWVAVTLDYSLDLDLKAALADVWSGVTTVENQWYADPERQILFGDSAGGHLAALIAVQHPEHFAGQVLWSPVISLRNAYQDGIGGTSARGKLSRAALQVAGPAGWQAADPSRSVTQQTPPAWIAGSSQEFVAFARQGQLLADALGSRAQVHLVAGQLHGKKLEQGPLLRSARTWARVQVS